MQEEILTFQFGAFSNSIVNDLWDLEQLNADEATKEAPEALQNSIFLRGDAKRPRTIIFDLKDNLDKYSFYQTRASKEVDKENIPYWDQNKIQVVDLQDEEEKVDTKKKKASYFSKFALSERNFVRVPPADNFFNNYQHGNRLLQSNEQLDDLEDKVRYFLEDADYLRGFQFFLDTNSGYGSISKYILQYLNEECPKNPVIMYGFENEHYAAVKENEKILEGMKFLNKMVSMYEMREYVTCYIPIEVDNILSFQNLNPNVMSVAPKQAYNLLSLLISNISVPYRLTSISAHRDSIKTFIEQLLPYPELNIFNAAFHIPGYPQILNEKEITTQLTYEPTIFQYKEYKPLSLFSITNRDKSKTHLKHFTSFGEDFVLRGHLSGVKIPRSQQSLGFNFHLQDTDILLHENVYKLLDPKILQNYEVVSPGQNQPDIYKVPFHSVLYSSEMIKFYMEDLSKAYKTIERGAKLQFLKEDYTEDDFKEMENYFHNMRDSYDNGKDEEGNDPNDDEDF